MYLLSIFLSFFNFLFLICFGRFFTKNFLLNFSIFNIFLSSLISFFIFYEIFFGLTKCFINLNYWFNLYTLSVSWSFLFDYLSVIMLIVILFISSLVHYYSIEYMSNDPFLIRFLSYLSLFTFFMLILITSSNFIQLFLGWEGVGLSSYLLVNFWFTRVQANKSAMKAMIVNRFGDAGLYLAIIFIFFHFNSIDFLVLSNLTLNLLTDQSFYLTIIVLCIFIWAIGKSAQLGLHTWLPNAMEGLTPVSALIHAATMVTAGVFILIRSQMLLELSNTILLYIFLIGSLTAFFAGSIGGFQYDLKKVIAYSTCSQLGYMVFACGISAYGLALFHLFTHAFFKALLFLGAGSIIHAMSDEQDMRKMGGLFNILPFTYISMIIGSVSLIGLPFLSGFYSKDAILEYAYSSNYPYLFSSYMLCSFAIFFTTFYSCRVLYLTFFNGCNFNKQVPYESDFKISIVLFILSFLSIMIGYLFKEYFLSGFFISLGFNFFNGEFLLMWIKHIPLICIFIGFFYIYSYIFKFWKQLNWEKVVYIFHFLNQKWYFDLFYKLFIINPVMIFGYKISYKLIDRGVLEIIGPEGIINLKNNLQLIQKFFFVGYIFYSVFIIFLLFIFLFLLIDIFSLSILSFFFFSILVILFFKI